MSSVLRVLMLGDCIGMTGRALFARHAASFIKEYKLNALIVNGENSADNGKGITPEIAEFFFQHGASIVTTGNHIWDQPNIMPYLQKESRLLRPANLPLQNPGKGIAFFKCNDFSIAVINLMGRVFMDPILECPFEKIKDLVVQAKEITPLIFIDFHAQASAEKIGFGKFVDGKVTAIVGTHTHTQTADARILPYGTAYITDLGMSGSLYSVIGFNPQDCIQTLTTGIKTAKSVMSDAPYIMTGALITADTKTGKALSIERFQYIDNQPLEGLV